MLSGRLIYQGVENILGEFYKKYFVFCLPTPVSIATYIQIVNTIEALLY
jgi:hypothetical protein